MIYDPLTFADLVTAAIGVAAFVLMIVVNRLIATHDYHRNADKVSAKTLAWVRRIPHDHTDG